MGLNGGMNKAEGQIAQNVLSRLAASYGFSKYSGEVVDTDATARNSPSGLSAGFSGHPCPEIAGYIAEY